MRNCRALTLAAILVAGLVSLARADDPAPPQRASAESSVGQAAILGKIAIQGRVDDVDGVAGVFENVAGGTVLSGSSGGTEIFRVDGTGTVTASAFGGDGSALTGLDPANLEAGTAAIDITGTAATASGLACSGCVSPPELDFDPATQSELEAALAVNRNRVAILGWYQAREAVEFPVGDSPFGVAFDGSSVWVVNQGDNSVTKLRASDGTNLGTFPVGPCPDGIAFDGANLWVANQCGDSISKLRASDGANLGTFPVGDFPRFVAYDGASVWVTNSLDATVSKLRASDGAVLGTFPTDGIPDGSGLTGGVAFDGVNVWVANTGPDTVTKLRASDGANLGTFSVGAGTNPFGVAFDGASIWVALNTADAVVKLRVSDGQVLGTFPVGSQPFGVAFDGTGIWVTNTVDDTVTRLRASDGAVLGTFPVSDGGSIAFDGANVWVTNSQVDTVSKL